MSGKHLSNRYKSPRGSRRRAFISYKTHLKMILLINLFDARNVRKKPYFFLYKSIWYIIAKNVNLASLTNHS